MIWCNMDMYLYVYMYTACKGNIMNPQSKEMVYGVFGHPTIIADSSDYKPHHFCHTKQYPCEERVWPALTVYTDTYRYIHVHMYAHMVILLCIYYTIIQYTHLNIIYICHMYILYIYVCMYMYMHVYACLCMCIHMPCWFGYISSKYN